MFGKKALPVGTVVVILVLALAGLGLGFALWSTTLTDQGTVNTGTFVADWFNVFTDDDGGVVDPNKDAGDTGDCATDPACVFGAGSRDPMAPGPNPARYDKAIGACASWILPEEDHKVLHWQLDNVYPSYYCTVWGHIRNMGSVPMKIQSRTLSHDAEITTDFVDTDVECGTQIDPGELLQIGMWVHVEQAALPEASYTGSSSYALVQWNEYDPLLCTGW